MAYFLPAFIAILLLIYEEFFVVSMVAFRTGPTLIAFGLIGLTVLSLVMVYLQTGFTLGKVTKSETPIRDVAGRAVDRAPGVEALESQLAALREELMNLEHSAVAFTEEQRTLLLDKLKTKFEEDAAASVLEQIKAQVTKTETTTFHTRELKKNFEDSRSRLSQELAALGRRGNLNLALGMMTTVTGLMFLGVFVLGSAPSLQEPWQFVTYFVPRLTLVIFIEVFAYFFLRLYKASLSEIKYFQNELTNLEAKFVALFVAVNLGDTNIINEVLSKFAATERNYILEKGQTTIELEKVKREKDTLSDIAKNLANVLPKKS